MADVRHTLLEATRALERAGVPDPRLDAEWLLAHVLGMDRLAMRMSGTAQLTPQQEQRMASLLLSRTRRTPLQYLLGTQGFYGLEIQTDARALIPRQETETLCETGIAHLRALGPLPPPAALDLCTGSGAIALALRHECPFAQVSASDASAEALSLARENARRLGLSVDFFAGDLFDAVGERRFDLILSNPPYQSDFSVAKRFIEKGFNRLKVGGRMMMVTKRLDWYRNRLRAVFGGVRVEQVDGYFVFTAERRSLSYASAAKKARKNEQLKMN